jgi:hypothetical protein
MVKEATSDHVGIEGDVVGEEKFVYTRGYKEALEESREILCDILEALQHESFTLKDLIEVLAYEGIFVDPDDEFACEDMLGVMRDVWMSRKELRRASGLPLESLVSYEEDDEVRFAFAVVVHHADDVAVVEVAEEATDKQVLPVTIEPVVEEVLVPAVVEPVVEAPLLHVKGEIQDVVDVGDLALAVVKEFLPANRSFRSISLSEITGHLYRQFETLADSDVQTIVARLVEAELLAAEMSTDTSADREGDIDLWLADESLRDRYVAMFRDKTLKQHVHSLVAN